HVSIVPPWLDPHGGPASRRPAARGTKAGASRAARAARPHPPPRPPPCRGEGPGPPAAPGRARPFAAVVARRPVRSRAARASIEERGGRYGGGAPRHATKLTARVRAAVNRWGGA